MWVDLKIYQNVWNMYVPKNIRNFIFNWYNIEGKRPTRGKMNFLFKVSVCRKGKKG